MPHAELQRHQGRKIGGDAKVGRVAERRQAAVAKQQVNARGEHREDEDLACQVDVVLAEPERKKNQKYQEKKPGLVFHAANFPNRPRGRKAITTIIGRNRIT